MDKTELYNRLPEIAKIRDDTIREEVEKVFLNYCPDYFWERPASSSGKYHAVDHRGQHGLWIHTKRAFVAFERLSDSYVEQGKINKQLQDCGRAAILVHDIFKYGKPEAANSHTVKDHDKLAATFLRNRTKLPAQTLECVDSHNGPWCKGKKPDTPLEQIHHLADMIASSKRGYFEVEEPHPDLEEFLIDIQK